MVLCNCGSKAWFVPVCQHYLLLIVRLMSCTWSLWGDDTTPRQRHGIKTSYLSGICLCDQQNIKNPANTLLGWFQGVLCTLGCSWSERESEYMSSYNLHGERTKKPKPTLTWPVSVKQLLPVMFSFPVINWVCKHCHFESCDSSSVNKPCLIYSEDVKQTLPPRTSDSLVFLEYRMRKGMKGAEALWRRYRGMVCHC